MLALHGQGRHDQVPAGDLGLLKLVGRLAERRRPARLSPAKRRCAPLFAPYGGWAGLAASHAYAL